MRNKDKPKKISLFLPDLRIGGAEHLTITLANDWSNKGYEIDLVILHQEISDDSLHSFVSPSVNIVNLNTKRFIFSIIPLASYFRKAKPNTKNRRANNQGACGTGEALRLFSCPNLNIVLKTLDLNRSAQRLES